MKSLFTLITLVAVSSLTLTAETHEVHHTNTSILAADSEQVTFKISGMMCESCSNHLRKVLGKTEGVIEVNELSHLDGVAKITYNPKKTTPTKITEIINATHYKVVDPDKEKAS